MPKCYKLLLSFQLRFTQHARVSIDIGVLFSKCKADLLLLHQFVSLGFSKVLIPLTNFLLYLMVTRFSGKIEIKSVQLTLDILGLAFGVRSEYAAVRSLSF